VRHDWTQIVSHPGSPGIKVEQAGSQRRKADLQGSDPLASGGSARAYNPLNLRRNLALA
jgi:hypothetical protein